MKINQLDRKTLIPNDLNSETVFRLVQMKDGTLKGVPMKRVTIAQFIKDADSDDVAYVEISEI